VNDIQRILRLQRDGQIDDPQAYLTKVCKAAEKAVAERLVLGNHNTDLARLEAAGVSIRRQDR
jgi:hypothetical protein